MADFDVENDTTPKLPYAAVGYLPSIAALKTAITGSGVAASYPASRLLQMTKNDLIYVCRVHGISVVGL